MINIHQYLHVIKKPIKFVNSPDGVPADFFALSLCKRVFECHVKTCAVSIKGLLMNFIPK